MSASRSRRETRKAETRDELVDAAARVFMERGYHGASLQHVAADAGFTTGAIYGQFDNKDDLFLAVYERYALARVDELRALLSDDGADFATRVRGAADQWTARHAESPAFTILALEFAVHALRHPKLRDALAARHSAVRLVIARALEEYAASTATTLPMPALELATVLRELGIGLTFAQLIDPGAVPPQLYGSFVETFCELALGETTVEHTDA